MTDTRQQAIIDHLKAKVAVYRMERVILLRIISELTLMASDKDADDDRRHNETMTALEGLTP